MDTENKAITKKKKDKWERKNIVERQVVRPKEDIDKDLVIIRQENW